MNWQKVPLEPGLTLVSTPIGAARDITLRALDVLASADVLVAEDTRRLRKLLELHGIPLEGRPVIAYHEHSGPGARSALIDRIKAGRSVAYATDAGTPLVADPGFQLVRAALEAGLAVHAAPGPSAPVVALTLSGLGSDRFLFAGFLPAAKAARRTALAELAGVPATLVLFESPKRVRECLDDLCDILGEEREAAICRELTKKFEEVRRGTLGQLRDGLEEIRGEVVLVIDRARGDQGAESLEDDLRRALRTMRVKDAAAAVAGAHGRSARDVYQLALRLKDGGDG